MSNSFVYAIGYSITLFKFRKFRKTDAVGFGCAAFHCFLNMIIRKDTTGIRDSPLGVPKMHSGASGFPLWSIGLSSMEHRAFLYGALVDAPQGVYRPPVRREISQWGRGPFGGTIEDNHFPKLQLF